MNYTIKTERITPESLPKLRSHVPESWKNAAGLLRSKHADLLRHTQRVRLEWSVCKLVT